MEEGVIGEEKRIKEVSVILEKGRRSKTTEKGGNVFKKRKYSFRLWMETKTKKKVIRGGRFIC